MKLSLTWEHSFKMYNWEILLIKHFHFDPYHCSSVVFLPSIAVFIYIYTGKLGYDRLGGTRKIGPSYAYDRLGPSYASVYVMALGISFNRYKSQNSKRI